MEEGGVTDGKGCLVKDPFSELREGGCWSDVDEVGAAVGVKQNLLEVRDLDGGGGLVVRCGLVLDKVVEAKGLVVLVEVVEGGRGGGKLKTKGL
jgi:hypothetical protein